MKKKEKIMIMILLVITVIAIIMLYNQRNPKSKNEENVKEEMVMVQEDGSKIAISDKLQEKRRIGDIEINNINIREEESGLAKITASTTNVGKGETQEMPIKILLKDKDENIITEVGAYIGKMKKGDQRGIMASANVTIDEVYDVEIKID